MFFAIASQARRQLWGRGGWSPPWRNPSPPWKNSEILAHIYKCWRLMFGVLAIHLGCQLSWWFRMTSGTRKHALSSLGHGSHRTWKTWKTWKNHGKKITLENSWKYHGKMTSLWKNEILSPELPKLVHFSKKIACGGLKLIGFWSQFPKNFACGGQSTYLPYLLSRSM